MSFRTIHPAHASGSGSSSPSSSKHPAPFGSGRPEERKGGGGAPPRRTRITPKDVTANACIQCKKARTKCDGKQPCFRCYQRNEGATCEYRVHVKMAKEEMLERFDQLAEQYRWAHQIMKALISDNHAPDIVERLKRGEDYRSVARSFQDTQLVPLQRPPSSRDSTGTIVAAAVASGASLKEMMDYEVESLPDPAFSTDVHPDEVVWTRTTTDGDLVSHLLELYFTWVHPIHMVLSEPHFRTSFESHDGVYCSPALVNVICAMACHLLDPTSAAATEDDATDVEAIVDDGLGDRFMDEGRSLIKPEDHNKLTTIQAFAIMFLCDAAGGKALKASSYIRFASSSLDNESIHQSVHRDAWHITMWGVHSLNVAWSEFTYECSESSHLAAANVLDGVRLDREDSKWRLYRHVDDIHNPPQPSLALLAANESARFLQIVQDTNALFYDTRATVVTARDVLIQYKRYLAWRDELPEAIAQLDMADVPLPHLVFLHVHFHTAMVSLLRPLVGLDQFARHSQINPEILALHHAQEGLHLLEQYRALYTCRHQPHLQVLCLLHLCDFLVRFGPPQQAREAATFCLESLKESRVGLSVCGPLQELFRRTLVECGVPLPMDIADLMAPLTDFCLDDVMDSCTRLSYTAPVEQVRRRLSPSIADDWDKEAVRLNATSSPGSSTSSTSWRRDADNEKLMKIRSILNQ
ncbi:MAG: hypothetical protein M1838_004508 [Thelocarpon superellum]|nr:MAG: hypothetical protein M1838_004508 [Thelocarpon superellum]